MAFRVTYSVLNADMTELHKEFDAALIRVRQSLGQEYPSRIGSQPFYSGNLLEDRNPANFKELLAKFHMVPISEIDRVMEISKSAQQAWERTPWSERARYIKDAAELISERRMDIAAIMSLEAGKSRMEAMGDVEESADLLRYYALQLEENQGYARTLGKLSPNENTRSILKPYGVFVVVSPFNFPLALAAGMTAGALLGGNSVVIKPSSETPWCAEKLYECFRDAGLPEGVFQVVHGAGSTFGDALVKHKQADGVVFTGSSDIGMKLWREFSTTYPKPCFLEMGGKNPAIVCESADLEKAAEGCVRSAFGLSGQKCSALSRLYVHKSIKEKFLAVVLEKTHALVMGDPTAKDTFVGPLINDRAVRRHVAAIAEAKREGKVLVGGESLRVEELRQGYFAEPTIVEVADNHRLFRDELFSPFVAINTFKDIEEALRKANSSEYGLTAGIFSTSEQEINYFMDHMEAGVLYANRKSGATTGAWPGIQSFCGWKASGSTGKGGCGPYYVAQFMREQSQTRIKE